MSKTVNVAFVQATKEILKEMGIEIKTTQVYELYSKLVGEKNWNIAQSKKINLESVIYENHSLEELVKNIDFLDYQKILEQIHIRVGWSPIEKIDPLVDSFGISSIISHPKGNVCIMYKPRKKALKIDVNGEEVSINHNFDSFTKKHISRLGKAMEHNKCERGILYTSAQDLPSIVYETAMDYNIEVVDHEDMLRLARQNDLKNKKFIQIKE